MISIRHQIVDTEGECPPHPSPTTQMGMSAPTPQMHVGAPTPLFITFRWYNWTESNIIFVFTLVDKSDIYIWFWQQGTLNNFVSKINFEI